MAATSNLSGVTTSAGLPPDVQWTDVLGDHEYGDACPGDCEDCAVFEGYE